MTVAHDDVGLRHLVDRLTLGQARRLRRLIDRKLSASAEKPTSANSSDEASCRRPSIVGCIAGGPTDLGERSEDYLTEYFNNSS